MNLGYHAGLRHGAWLRRRFARKAASPAWLHDQLNRARQRSPYAGTALPLTVVAFSCSRDLPEQLASLIALLANLGTPQRIWIASDGSHTPQETALLQCLDPCIQVAGWQELSISPLPDVLARHAAAHPLGRKLAVLHGLSQPGSPHLSPGTQLLYSDSDVLLFPDAGPWFANQPLPQAQGSYLLDCQAALDAPLLPGPQSARLPLNSGFLLFSSLHPPAWDIALSALAQASYDPGHYTEQTAVHLALTPPAYIPFPHHLFVVSILDQFRYRDMHLERQPDLALRHYVNNVRFKFWTQLHVAISSWQ